MSTAAESGLYQLTAHGIQDAVREGAATCASIIQSFLDRIEAVEGKVQAYVDVWKDSAMERAEGLDKAIADGGPVPPLAGVPVALKDVFCTTEGRTTCCSKMLANFHSPFDATVVKRLLEAGAIPMGKTNMDEFAMGSSTENSAVQLTYNPWNLNHVPGGSSGGSAAAVAADECAVALGSDTGGSVRGPAACCGCVGLKPTYGRVSRYGLVAFASSLDQVGPFTKDVEDSALVMNAIAGADPNDSTSAQTPVPDYTAALRDDVNGITVGLPKEYFEVALNETIQAKVNEAVKVLEGQGAKVVEISLPHAHYAVATYYVICTAEASANLARFDGVRYGFRAEGAKDVRELYTYSKTQGFGPEVRRRIMLGTYVLSSGYYDAYYLKAQKARSLIRDDFEKAFQQCDIILAPTMPMPAFPVGDMMKDPLEMYLTDVYTISSNLAGIPSISTPAGLTDDNLPLGLQLMGKHFDEETVLRTAYVYEQHAGLDMGRPPIA